MSRSLPALVALLALWLSPGAAFAQANSIMRSFHPEKFEKADADKAGDAAKPEGADKTKPQETKAVPPEAK